MYPTFLNKILLPLGSLLFSGNYSKYLKQWKYHDKMTTKELQKTQSEKLTKLLAYAHQNVPYYRKLKLPDNPQLKDFPILTKSILRSQTDSLLSDKFQKKDLEQNHSSGSSGEQSFTYMTHDHKFYLRALQTHWWTWGGFRPGEYLVQTGISPNRTLPKKFKDFFFRTNYLEAFSLKDDIINNALEKSKNKYPKHLAGYPSALNEMAKVAIAANTTYKFESLICYGDKLFGHYKDNFREAFDNPTVINTYGCAEGLYMACKWDIPYYYIMSPHVVLEIVDDNGNPVPDGNRGHILVTCLTNLAMPIIRYKLGDLGVLLPKANYPKKRKFNYPLLREVTGRETDVIKAPNGNILIIHSFTGILEYYQEIKQYKVIQTSRNSLLIEYISKAGDLSERALSEIKEKLEILMDGSMEIEFSKVEKIAPLPSGKPQIIEIRNKE